MALCWHEGLWARPKKAGPREALRLGEMLGDIDVAGLELGVADMLGLWLGQERH